MFCILSIFTQSSEIRAKKKKKKKKKKKVLKLTAVNTAENKENGKWEKLQDHIDCPSSFDELLNVDQLIPSPITQRQNSDDCNCKHNASYKQEG